jgi:hypothetical protein
MGTVRQTLTHEILTSAIKNRLEVSQDVADDLAFRVLNYFGFGDEIIDNVLDHDDRRTFYFLQDMQILATHWEEALLPSGRIWRVFYWDLNIERINQYAASHSEESRIEAGLYETLPEDVWSRSAA